MTEIDFHAKLAEAVQMIEQKGKEYAKARAISWQLQELKKTILSGEIFKQDPKLSMVEREAKARITKEYISYIEGTKEAIEKELTLEAEFERWKYQFEALRSLQSLEKEKMKMV